MICEQCHVGRYKSGLLPYLFGLGHKMVVVSNAPAYTCDMCHHTIYDSNFILNLQFLIDHTELKPGKNGWDLVTDDPSSWQSLKGANNRVG